MYSLSKLKGREPYVIIVLILAMLWGMGTMFSSSVSVVPKTAPDDVFSGQRAFDIAASLLAENVPHPAGSDANKVVRDRIVARLTALGLDSEIQSDFKCSHLSPGCAFVENIIGIKAGAAGSVDRPAILVTSHYDSVPAAPGAGDATSGVAAMLEIANNLNAMKTLENDVIFLFTDAEETGLRGAMAFADDHPLYKRVGLVLNLEARGVTGPSMMFETGPNNLKQIAGFKQASAAPTASSLIIEIYKRMPNATDYTVYKMHNLPGLNFAFSQGVSLYHAPKDDIDHLDIKSVQHQGDNVLAALKVFGDQDLTTLAADEDATYFDVFGMFLVSWAASMGLPFLLLGTVGFIALIWQQGGANVKQIIGALACVLLTIVALPVVGWLLSMPLGPFGGLQPLAHPFPWPARFALLAAVLLVSFMLSRLALKLTNSSALFYVVWSVYLLLALITVLIISGASYMFLVPFLAAMISGALWSLKDREAALYVASIVGTLAAAYMALYHFAFTEVLMNFQLSHFKINTMVLLALPLLSLSVFWRQANKTALLGPNKLVAGLLFVTTVMAIFVPAATPDRPMPMVLSYHAGDDAKGAFWQVQGVDKTLRPFLDMANFSAEKQAIKQYGVSQSEAWIKPAQDYDIFKPTYNLTRNEIVDGKRMIEGTISSNRASYQLGLSISQSEKVETLHIADQLVLGHPDRPSRGARLLRLHGAGQNAVSFKLILVDAETPDLFVFDQGYLSVIADAQELTSLRPDYASTVHMGDHSVAVRKIALDN